MDEVIIIIDGKEFTGKIGENLLSFLLKNHFQIPHMCYHSDFEPEENCRLCLVEVNGRIKTSCNVKIKPGLKVKTNSEKIKKLRNINLLLLQKAKLRKKNRQKFNFDGIINYDMSKCIDCRNCLKVCSLLENINAVEMVNYGYQEVISPTKNPCVYCGQCLAHCPVKAISTNEDEYQRVVSYINDKDYIKIAQIAPSIRVAIGEEFGLEHGLITTNQLVEALKKIGFDYVFDTSFAADITTIEEAKELVERMKENKKLPMFTSCCPGWVRYVQSYYSKLEPLLTSVLSPEIKMGNLIKHFFAKNKRLDLKKVKVVSIMPCTAKKWEVKRKEFIVDNYYPVDDSLTTVEIARLIKEKGIDFKNLKGMNFDNPLGEATGAGIIFGATGGVMTAALRTAYYYLTGNNPKDLYFEKEIASLKGVKIFQLKILNKKLRIAIIDGLGNFKSIVNQLSEFDYIEVMACPGGCLSGGGQPKPINDEIREKRKQALLSIDKNKQLRLAHENPQVKEIYKQFLNNEEKIKKYCHLHSH